MFGESFNSEEEFFDVESLPDIDGDGYISNQFIDIVNTQKTEASFAKKDLMDLSRTNDQYSAQDVIHFRLPTFERSESTVTIRFKISKQEIAEVKKLTHGILSQEFSVGLYVFDIKLSEDGGEDLYYGGVVVGEFVGGQPRVYKRFFFPAATRKMCQSELLFEYEFLKFTIHPKLYKKLQLSNPEMVDSLTKMGLPLFTEEQMQEILDKRQAKSSPQDT